MPLASAASDPPDLSIVIVNWNTRDLLAACLESVISNHSVVGDHPEITDHRLVSTGQRSLVTEVIVVDNASSDGSVAMVRDRFPWVTLIENTENLGFARANNQALRLASGRYLLLLNSDTEIRPRALETLVMVLEAHPEAGAAGPRVLNPDGSLQNCYGSLPSVLDEVLGPYWADFFTKPWGWLGGRLAYGRSGSNAPFPVDRVSFACTLIRREALEQVGFLDEGFAFYSEDYDWFKRLKDAGWVALYCSQAEIVHHWGASSRQRSEWAIRQLYRSKRRYFAKHYGALAERILCLGLALRFSVKAAVALALYPLRPRKAAQQLRLYFRLIQDTWGGLMGHDKI